MNDVLEYVKKAWAVGLDKRSECRYAAMKLIFSVLDKTNRRAVDSVDEMIDTAVLFRSCRNYHPKVNTVLMITWSGGSAVLGVDQIAKLNASVDVSAIQEPALSKMKKLISVIYSNPCRKHRLR